MKTIKKQHIFIAFIIIALIQWFVPLQMIFQQEDVLKTGNSYKFKTRPIDPSDPYRGKYITLDYELSYAKTTETYWETNQDVYLYLKNDSLGYAAIKAISKTPLNTKEDYIITKAKWYNNNKQAVYFNLPFNRFYMEETKAKPAEIAYTKAHQDSLPKNVYALVYVKQGKAVLKDVLINEISIANDVNH